MNDDAPLPLLSPCSGSFLDALIDGDSTCPSAVQRHPFPDRRSVSRRNPALVLLGRKRKIPTLKMWQRARLASDSGRARDIISPRRWRICDNPYPEMASLSRVGHACTRERCSSWGIVFFRLKKAPALFKLDKDDREIGK
jgi:hypothetical protein